MRVIFALLLVLGLILSCSALAQDNKDIVNMTEENEVVFAIISDPHMGSSEPSNTNKMFHYNQDMKVDGGRDQLQQRC